MASIPLIQIRDTLIISIQVELSDRLVLELKDHVSQEICRRRGILGVVIEVSGIDIFDSFIARSIRDIAQIAHLLGVKAVLAGVDPGMAITLVEMGMLMSGVETALNLDMALEKIARYRTEHVSGVEEALQDLLGAGAQGADPGASAGADEKVSVRG